MRHWVIYHSIAWDELVEQGYFTYIVEKRHGVDWALMNMDRIECPFCGSTETCWVDSLGELTHGQCRACGVIFTLGQAIDLPEMKYAEDLVNYDYVAIYSW